MLAAECGLHILEITAADAGARRATARVRLVRPPAEDLPKPKMHPALATAFKTSETVSTVVRRYRREPSPLVRNADGSWRTGKYDSVLGGNFDLACCRRAILDVPPPQSRGGMMAR
jgi:hypothetical protein